MRYIYLVVGILCAAVLFLSNTIEKDAAKNLFFTDGNKSLELPETPYDYGKFIVPTHLTLLPYANTNNLGFRHMSNEGITLGRVLFYDELLSANENISCASCHQQQLSFADNVPLSAGVNEETQRNALHLNDLGWSNNLAFFWDLSEGDLEEMIVLPLLNENEIGVTDINGLIEKMLDTDYYPNLFEEAYGEPTVNLTLIQDALSQFIRSMTTFNSKFDQVLKGEAEYTLEENFGHQLFELDCAICHFHGNPNAAGAGSSYPANVINSSFVYDNRMETEDDEGAGVWINKLRGDFKVPTIRNIALTAPYMHDGRFADLEAVIDHYSEDLLDTEDWSPLPEEGGLDYVPYEKTALLAFLKTLTDKTITEDIRWSDPFTGPTVGIDNPILASSVSIFPNPSNGITHISFDNLEGRNIEAHLVNTQGQLVRKLSTHKNGLMTDVSQLPAGMYWVRIKNGNAYLDKKLLVQ